VEVLVQKHDMEYWLETGCRDMRGARKKHGEFKDS
jgi:hypothetical protein